MRKEREINLKNMLWYVIRGWRAIIICMLILAILFGVRQYRTDYNNAVANQNVVTPSLLDIKNSLSEQEMREKQKAAEKAIDAGNEVAAEYAMAEAEVMENVARAGMVESLNPKADGDSVR